MAEARHSRTFSGNLESLRAAARPCRGRAAGQRLLPARFNGCQPPGDVAGERRAPGGGGHKMPVLKDGEGGRKGIPCGGEAARPPGRLRRTPGPAAGRAGTHRGSSLLAKFHQVGRRARRRWSAYSGVPPLPRLVHGRGAPGPSPPRARLATSGRAPSPPSRPDAAGGRGSAEMPARPSRPRPLPARSRAPHKGDTQEAQLSLQTPGPPGGLAGYGPHKRPPSRRGSPGAPPVPPRPGGGCEPQRPPPRPSGGNGRPSQALRPLPVGCPPRPSSAAQRGEVCGRSLRPSAFFFFFNSRLVFWSRWRRPPPRGRGWGSRTAPPPGRAEGARLLRARPLAGASCLGGSRGENRRVRGSALGAMLKAQSNFTCKARRRREKNEIKRPRRVF